MKSLLITALLVSSILANAQTSLDVRFEAKETVQAVTLVHNQKNIIPWQGFFKVFPNNMLWEIGPTFKIGPIGIATRIGIHFKTGKYKQQEAIVLSGKWKSFRFVSINEFSPFKGTNYFYEHELRYKCLGIHAEAQFIGKQFEPFVGPTVYPKLKKIPGNLYFSVMKQATGNNKLARLGYKIIF